MADTIEREVAEWSSDANEAVEICLIDHHGKELASFHPRFTYPIFGEEEAIFGYKDLNIKLSFAADACSCLVEVSYAERFRPVGDVKATDLNNILKDFLPSEAFGTRAQFDQQLSQMQDSAFTPPGRCIHSFARGGKNYEIWYGELSEDGPKETLGRIQIMTSFFVEGGVPLDLDEEAWARQRWRVFFIYEKHSEASPTYRMCGYATSYRFITFQPGSYRLEAGTTFDHPFPSIQTTDLPNRSRISQFVIFPSSQRLGLGRHLYKCMVDQFLADSACIEITVEDPNEAFDDLRDYSDFARLTANGTFAQLKLNIDIDPKLTANRPGVVVPTKKLVDVSLLEKLRVKNKIASRQWKRLVDMHFLKGIPKYSREGGLARLTQRAKSSDPGDRAYYYWRLLVKERIYKQNLDIMAQFDLPDRIMKLEETTAGQIAEYERLLARVADEEARGPDDDHGAQPASQRSRKRVIDDDEDEDMMSEPKRARTEDGD